MKKSKEINTNDLVVKNDVSYTIPYNWVWTRLGFIGDYINGKAFKSNEWSENGLPIIRIQNLTNSNKNSPNYYQGDIDEKYIINPQDFLISWSGTLGAYLWNGPQGVLNQHIFKVRTRINKLYHYYLTKNLIAEMYSKTHGSGMVHVTKKVFDSIIVPLPPLNEQKRIADKIESLFAKIDEAKRLIDEAKESFELRRAAILDKAFRGELTKKWRNNNPTKESFYGAENKSTNIKKFKNHLDEKWKKKLYLLPEGWSWIQLNELIENSAYGTSLKTDDKSNGIPVIRMGNLTKDGEFILHDLKYLPENFSDKEKLNLEEDDILFNRTNSYELVGKSGVVSKDLAGKFTFASYLIRIRLHEKEVFASYVCRFINSYFGREMLLSMVTQQVGQANINSQKLASIFIPVPPKEELYEINSLLNKFLNFENNIEEIMRIDTNISTLKQSILQKAFRGELGTNDPTEDSSLELLKETLQSQVK